MSHPDPLPVSVLIPTRDSMPHLPRHAQRLNEWLARAAEVVVVDSHSGDGTVDFLRRELKHPGVRFLSHPPGLYESWNFGIAQLTAPFTYIATVGDCIVGEQIAALAALAEERQADVVISPPRLISPGGQLLRRRWPIHEFLEQRPLTAPRLLAAEEAFLWHALSVPGSLLGSSASNLYRTTALQERPFPTAFRHAGDTAWALQSSPHTRTVIAPQVESEFLVHPRTARHRPEAEMTVRQKLHALARETFLAARAQGRWPGLAAMAEELNQFWDEMDRALTANNDYAAQRKTPLWFLRPTAWQARSRRERHVRRARAVRSSLLLKSATAFA